MSLAYNLETQETTVQRKIIIDVVFIIIIIVVVVVVNQGNCDVEFIT